MKQKVSRKIDCANFILLVTDGLISYGNEKSVNLSEITIFRRHAFIFKLILPI